MSLKEYSKKRKFDSTPEPRPRPRRSAPKGPLRFVVQKHAATRTHYDFRLEIDGALKSWAVPKGPSLTSQDPRLAVYVEDHPIEYGSFEGVIPKGNYGAGTVMIWDAGSYVERGSKGRADSEKALRKGLADGHLTFVLEGKKLRGEFALIKLKKKGAPDNGWLLIKKHDAEATRRDVLLEDRSTVSGRSLGEIAAQAVDKGEIWIPGKGRATKVKKRPVKPPVAPAPKKRELPKRDLMPRRVRVMQPVASTLAPNEAGMLFESFGEGHRAVAEVERGRVRLYSRAFLPFERKYPALAQALKKLEGEAVLDGEIVGAGKKAVYLISDLLYLDGKDLRGLTLRERKTALSRLPLKAPLKVAKWATTPRGLTAPTLVAKRADSPYRSGTAREWLSFRPKTSRSPAKAPKDSPPLTHLNKIYWPEEGYTKGDLVRYYEQIADTLMPYLVDRPQSMHRQPDGIRNEGFFHKDMSSFLPRRMETVRVVSASSAKTINYVLCQDRWSLLYLVNLGCIELNPWLSKRPHLERPDMVVIDLDPDGNAFAQVVRVAQEVRRVLDAVGAESHCKTSGASGLHICLPTGGRFDFETGRKFAEAVCRIVNKSLPEMTSVERSPAKRRGRIYLDFLQNRRGQTLAAPYCVRPRPGATVSTPLKWSEVKVGLDPTVFTIQTMARRLKKVGDLWRPLLDSAVDIEACMKRLSKRFHI